MAESGRLDISLIKTRHRAGWSSYEGVYDVLRAFGNVMGDFTSMQLATHGKRGIGGGSGRNFWGCMLNGSELMAKADRF